MSDYCITSELGSVRRENGIGTIQLSNRYGINISDEGLVIVYKTYMAEVLKIKEQTNE